MLLLGGALAACSASTDPRPSPASGAIGGTPAASAALTGSSAPGAYRDGRYTATGWYGSLPSHHDVTLTIEDGVVTDVDITTPAEDDTSLGYQERFAQALPEAIVGRSVDGIRIDRLAGSSGCSDGFMDALAKIKADAQA